MERNVYKVRQESDSKKEKKKKLGGRDKTNPGWLLYVKCWGKCPVFTCNLLPCAATTAFSRRYYMFSLIIIIILFYSFFYIFTCFDNRTRKKPTQSNIAHYTTPVFFYFVFPFFLEHTCTLDIRSWFIPRHLIFTTCVSTHTAKNPGYMSLDKQ